ncbi:IncF plasmid conjugative transfer pilus assembly protein TraB [Thiorhodococcus drewsii AZ1]|uniref:IncF plasmid conjugative transfer pilus assembly protein TraB n=1 Tax=Thiorhodococcus drewsii AZ1 TaxID=765913 RepID=G2E4I8_9GAMM|nr:TraB/VirB10 family protein [Thiorhodococcus drewsii]EGV29609.1 IncF plasmid conjugative transfer pilus assembly protein TraB [Thiorhodococcus drewsii AZ1]
MPVTPADTWERLSPGLRRWLLIGVVLGVVALIAVIALDEPATPGTRAEQARERLTRHLLTDADPRALGIDGLANRLTQLERELAQATSRERQRGPGEAATLNRQVEQLRQSQQSEIQALQQEITRLREELQARPATLTSTTPPPSQPPEPPAPESKTSRPAKPPALDDPALFARTPASPLSALSPHPAAQPTRASGPLTIRVVEQAPAPNTAASATTKQADDPAGTAIMIPAGSLLRGVLLSGMDAPTGRQARRDPYPALVRLKHDAILPNRFRADVRECFITVAGYGELSSERAFLRTEVITCVRRDGGVIEVPVDGYAVGEDGKVGLRGRLVSKQGQVIARAMQVSFLQGISDVFNTSSVTTISTTSDGKVQYQDVLSSDSAQAAAITGTGKALDRLAQYYLDMAENIFPVIEVDAGRAIEVILNRGASLQLAQANRRRGGRR